MCPLLTLSSIESIHDLHPFFTALLLRSNQGTTLHPTTSQSQMAQTNDASSISQPISLTGNNNNHISGMSKRTSKNKSKIKNYFSANIFNNNVSTQQPFILNHGGGCSLDELFLNIDSVIANDFLEPLPSASSTSE